MILHILSSFFLGKLQHILSSCKLEMVPLFGKRTNYPEDNEVKWNYKTSNYPSANILTVH